MEMQRGHLRALQAVARPGSFSRAAAPDVIRAVAEADLDVGVVGLPVRRRDLVVVPFVTDEFVAIAAPRHWRSRSPIDAAALQGERLILDQPGAMSRRLVDAWLHRRGVAPTVPAELGNTEATKELVSAARAAAGGADRARHRAARARASSPSLTLTAHSVRVIRHL
jgi:DNA-binding transcriptional LysR family regulator